MDISAGTLALADNGMVSSTGNMTIGVNNLTFGGSRSSIVAATSGTGAANVTTGMAFNNLGAVHSGGDMTFNAPSITNSGTGAFSALPGAGATVSTKYNRVALAGNSGLFGAVASNYVMGGAGAVSVVGAASVAYVSNATSTGTAGAAATGYAAGGSGAANANSQSATAGGNGAPGLIIVYEYS